MQIKIGIRNDVNCWEIPGRIQVYKYMLEPKCMRDDITLAIIE